MKTLKKVPIELIRMAENEYLPKKENMEFGKLYYSEYMNNCTHLCLCGCGHECYLPISDDDWNIVIKNNKVTITPSILQRFDCKSHYIITNGIANFV